MRRKAVLSKRRERLTLPGSATCQNAMTDWLNSLHSFSPQCN